MSPESNQNILKFLEEKISLKQEVLDNSKAVFDEMKQQLSQIASQYKSPVKNISKDLVTSFRVTGDFEAELVLADETLIFSLHTNIFTFDNSHEIWKTKYVKQDVNRAYCGKIFIYNFLTDSFRYNRINDVGYLIARIFINKEKHFFIEGEKQLGNLYSDFSTSMLDSENIHKIIEAAIFYSLNFDPFTPPFEKMEEISVRDILDASIQSRIATGKRLGFQFNESSDEGQ